jgi:hypothetical protein
VAWRQQLEQWIPTYSSDLYPWLLPLAPRGPT